MIPNIRKLGLEGVKFNSPVGYFEEERILKNNFLVDVYVVFEANGKTESLHNTIDYTHLYQICEHFFKMGAMLIETVGQNILDEIKQNYPFVDTICIKINKLNPPVKAEIQNSFIELTYQKET